MAKFQIEWMQEYVGFAEIEANSKEEAIEKFKAGQYCETDYQVQGDKYIQELTKNINGKWKKLDTSKWDGEGL